MSRHDQAIQGAQEPRLSVVSSLERLIAIEERRLAKAQAKADRRAARGRGTPGISHSHAKANLQTLQWSRNVLLGLLHAESHLDRVLSACASDVIQKPEIRRALASRGRWLQEVT